MSNKLELTWLGKKEQVKVELRLLIENSLLSNLDSDIETEKYAYSWG